LNFGLKNKIKDSGTQTVLNDPRTGTKENRSSENRKNQSHQSFSFGVSGKSFKE